MTLSGKARMGTAEGIDRQTRAKGAHDLLRVTIGHSLFPQWMYITGALVPAC